MLASHRIVLSVMGPFRAFTMAHQQRVCGVPRRDVSNSRRSGGGGVELVGRILQTHKNVALELRMFRKVDRSPVFIILASKSCLFTFFKGSDFAGQQYTLFTTNKPTDDLRPLVSSAESHVNFVMDILLYREV